jgi:hypothetical protein
LSGSLDDHDLARPYLRDGVGELRNQRAQVNESGVRYFDDDHTDIKAGHVLLVAHALIDRDENVELQRRTREQLAVLERRPTLFLRCPD